MANCDCVTNENIYVVSRSLLFRSASFIMLCVVCIYVCVCLAFSRSLEFMEEETIQMHHADAVSHSFQYIFFLSMSLPWLKRLFI